MLRVTGLGEPYPGATNHPVFITGDGLRLTYISSDGGDAAARGIADGAVVRDSWDGRAAWRNYRELRSGRLIEVNVDPQHRIAVDVIRHNDGMRLEGDSRTTADYAGWLGAVASWLAGGLSLWL